MPSRAVTAAVILQSVETSATWTLRGCSKTTERVEFKVINNAKTKGRKTAPVVLISVFAAGLCSIVQGFLQTSLLPPSQPNSTLHYLLMLGVAWLLYLRRYPFVLSLTLGVLIVKNSPWRLIICNVHVRSGSSLFDMFIQEGRK